MTCDAGFMTIVRGTTLERDLSFSDPETGLGIDLNGAGIWFRVKAQPGNDADPILIACSVGDGITLQPQSGETLGHAILRIEPLKSVIVTPGQYTYEVFLRESDGFTSSTERGRFVLEGEVVKLLTVVVPTPAGASAVGRAPVVS